MALDTEKLRNSMGNHPLAPMAAKPLTLHLVWRQGDRRVLELWALCLYPCPAQGRSTAIGGHQEHLGPAQGNWMSLDKRSSVPPSCFLPRWMGQLPETARATCCRWPLSSQTQSAPGRVRMSLVPHAMEPSFATYPGLYLRKLRSFIFFLSEGP